METKEDKDPDSIQSRTDDEFISDQEPHATSKGKKKYRLPTRLYRKGEGEGPGRKGYGSYGDQDRAYGLGTGPSYDSSYGKGYEDYYTGGKEKPGLYDDYMQKGEEKVRVRGKEAHTLNSDLAGSSGGGKYLSTGYGEAFGAGHSSYSTSKGHGKGYGHGQGHKGGGHGHGLGGYLDPFSILGGLAFLVYLGLLFQQSMTPAGMRAEEDLLSLGPFNSPALFLKRTSREYRSLGGAQPELDLDLEGLRSAELRAEDCPLLRLGRLLHKVQGESSYA